MGFIRNKQREINETLALLEEKSPLYANPDAARLLDKEGIAYTAAAPSSSKAPTAAAHAARICGFAAAATRGRSPSATARTRESASGDSHVASDCDVPPAGEAPLRAYAVAKQQDESASV